MQSHLIHLNCYKKNFMVFFFFIQYKKEKRKMPNLSTKERKGKFNTDDLIFRK